MNESWGVTRGPARTSRKAKSHGGGKEARTVDLTRKVKSLKLGWQIWLLDITALKGSV